ncbi:MAG: LacI family DNA-binding transcriptional regulator [Lachnospiraceae bacterium]
MATMHDIAQKLGISKGTVSKGLNNASDISEDMRKKILETAVELGYVHKRLQKKEQALCILVANMDYDSPNSFGYDIILGFKQMAALDNWTIDVYSINETFQKEHPYGVFMMEHGYQAAFILGLSLIDPWMKELKTTNFATVLFDNYIADNPHIATVGCDSQEGFNLAIKYLKEQGHTKIGLISGPLESYILKARYQAYLNALEKYGLTYHEDYVGLEYFVAESARTYVPKLYKLGVTAILCSHDLRALATLTECHDRGIRVPEEISIIGFDDLPISAHAPIPLTTIRQDRISLGKCGYYAITCLLNNVAIGSILLRAPLVVRESTGTATEREVLITTTDDNENHKTKPFEPNKELQKNEMNVKDQTSELFARAEAAVTVDKAIDTSELPTA